MQCLASNPPLCLTDPQARVNQPLRSRHYNSGHAARVRIQQHHHQHDEHETTSHAIVITASNAHEKLASPSDGLRELVGDFGLTLFNPLACCTTPRDARIVWELQDDDEQEGQQLQEGHNIALATPKQLILRDLSCISVASTAVTTPESEDILTALQIEEEPDSVLQDCPRILSMEMLQQLHDQGLPESLQMCRWERCFAIGRDGDSFYTLLERCNQYQRTFVVIQTTAGHVLGGYAAMPWKKRNQISNTYFGTGQSFLFASHPEGKAQDNLIDCTDNTLSSSSSSSSPLILYRWTGSNDFCQICDPEEGRLGMGGGSDFGFLVQDDLQRGRTGPCGTFGNPALTTDYFEIQALEIYGLRPFGESISSSSVGSPTYLQAFFG